MHTLTAHNIKLHAHNESDWATRGDYWLKRLNPPRQNEAKRRRKSNKPLVLSGHGIHLKVEADTLLITCGFTHYPQSREQYRFFNGDRQMPSRIVILDGDGSITLDALEWLSNHCVSLVQLDWKGNVSGVGSATYAANPEYVKRQLALQDSGNGFDFMKRLVVDKLNNAVDTIQSVPIEHPDIDIRLNKLRNYAERITKGEFETNITLLSAEAIAAVAYFQCWYHYELRWRGIKRKPIPPEWKSLNTRVGKNGNSNKFATHPINAILNYAYGMLENQVKGLITVKGLDPTIPIFHAQNRSGVALVHDLMEPVRPVMDKHILKFMLGRTFAPDDFVLNKDGVVRLHPQFARFLVKSIQDIPEIEIITINNIKKLIN
jgi:CRISP-associated protein Cas1